MFKLFQKSMMNLLLLLGSLAGFIPSHAESFPVNATNASWGVHVHAFTQRDANSPAIPRLTGQDLDAMAAAGFSIVRLDVLWSIVERKADRYDFSDYDPLIEALIARKLRPMMILGLGNPAYPDSQAVTKNPATRAAYERFVLAVVDHYKHRGIIWELINEPNSSEFFALAQAPSAENGWRAQPDVSGYLKLVMPLFTKMRALDPSGYLVAPSSQGVPDENFLQPCFAGGLLAVIDAVTVHPYQIYPRVNPPETVDGYMLKLRRLIQQYAPPGKEIPFVWGEWGYPVGKDSQSIDEATQNAFTQRQLLLGSLYEVPANVLYSWKGALTEHNEQSYELGFGFRRADGSFRPAYDAMATLNQALTGYRFKRRLPTAPEDYLLMFENTEGKQLLAAWTTQQTHRVQWQNREVSIGPHPIIVPAMAVHQAK